MILKMSHVISAIIAICCTATSLAMMTSHTLRKEFDSSGNPVCSVDPPSDVLRMSSGFVQCCRLCSISSVCLYCQHKADMDQCELYNDLPRNYTVIDQCIGFTLLVSCPIGWIQGGNRCYKLADSHFVGWQQAADYCAALNPSQQSQLIKIDSDDKQLMIAGLVAQLVPVSSSAFRVSISTNIARNKTTWGSSYYVDWYGTNYAYTAVDGSRASNLYLLQCFCSGYGDTNPWWAVDLGSLADVFGAALTNRNIYESREDNFIVGLTNNTPTTMPPTTYGYTVCGQWAGDAPASATMFVQCAANSPPARYVTIVQAPPPAAYLQIFVLSPYHVNLALNRPTMQSSNSYSHFGVDGNNDTDWSHSSCAGTNAETRPWWAVDLGSPTDVYGVDFTNRGDCCASREDNFIVALTNNPPSTTSPPTSKYAKCGQWPGAAPGGQTLFVRCADNLPAARYVAILGQQPGNQLQVCEVAVYGKVHAWLSGKWVDSLGTTTTNNFVWIDYPNTPQFMAYNSTWELGKPSADANSSCLAMNVASGAWRSVSCQSWNPALFYAVCEVTIS